MITDMAIAASLPTRMQIAQRQLAWLTSSRKIDTSWQLVSRQLGLGLPDDSDETSSEDSARPSKKK